MKRKYFKQLAIIIPVHNVENYVGELIRSIKKQDFKDYSAYLIDDGSTDKSLSIIKEFAKSDPRFTVLAKENGGPGSARNMGLNYIEKKGYNFKYIWFCDADDIVEDSVLSVIISALDRNKADYGLFSVKRFNKNKVKCYTPSITNETLLTNNDIICQYYRYGSRWKKEPCSEAFLNNKIFKYEKVKKIRFREDVRRAEDFDYFIKASHCLNLGVLKPNVFYRYRLRKSSLTNALSVKGDLKICLEHYKELDKYSKNEQVALQHRLIRAFYLEICDSWGVNTKKAKKLIDEFGKLEFRFKWMYSDYKIRILLKYLPILLPSFIKFRNLTKPSRSQEDFFE